MRYLLIAIALLTACPAWSAILVTTNNGNYIQKPTLRRAATDPDTAGKTIVVTSALSAVQSNISSATMHAWPADRALKVEKGGSIGNTTKFDTNNQLTAGLYHIFSGSGTVNGLTAVHPEWWGAKADGSTNSTSAIKKAVLSGAGVVYFDGGVYMCDPISFGEGGVDHIGVVRLSGHVAAMAGSYLEQTTKTTRIKATTPGAGTNAYLWKVNYSHNLIIEDISFDGSMVTDRVYWLQQGCSRHKYSNCTFEGATPATGYIVYLGDDTINIEVSYIEFDHCMISGGNNIIEANYPAGAVYAKQSNTLIIDFNNCMFRRAINLITVFGAKITISRGDYEEFTGNANTVIGVAGLVVRDSYTECATGLSFFTYGSMSYNNAVSPIILDNNILNTSAGLNINALTDIPMVITNNRIGCAIYVANPISSTNYHKVTIQGNKFINTGGGYGLIGPGSVKYVYTQNNSYAGVAIENITADVQDFVLWNAGTTGGVPGEITLTTTVQGAAIGDKVNVTYPGVMPTGFILDGYVSSASTITLRWTQLYGAAADPDGGGGYYVVEWFKKQN